MSKLVPCKMGFVLGLVLLASWANPQGPSEILRFISYNEALPILQSSKLPLPAELKSGKVNAETWAQWVQANDRAVRQRLETGEEDTLTNLLRFGVTFTKEYRIDNAYLARYGSSDLVNSFANRRADDLVRALSAPGSNQGIHHVRLFLEKKGFSFATPQHRAKVKAYLLANLARMRDEFVSYSEKLKSATIPAASELYADRGVSLDTNLWPDFALHQQFQNMRDKGLLTPGSVRRIAIIGPGLDFANKESGSDFYPPQTTQPFAVIDSLAQLGLADPTTLVLYTFDISSGVNVHLAQARRGAQAGQPYTVQLTWDQSVPRSPAYLSQFQPYWSELGKKIATPTRPVSVPGPLASSLKTRAIKIHSKVVAKITPVDMNIVYQRLPLPPEAKFDLVIGTNVFVYYGAFEQSLARANLAAMVKFGGFVLSNDLLADVVPSGLSEVLRRETQLSTQPMIIERMFCYRRDLD